MNIFGKPSDLPFFTQERLQEGEKSGFVYAWTGYYLQKKHSWTTFSLRKQPTFGDATTCFPAKWRLRNAHKNSVLMTRQSPDLGSASDCLNQISHAAQPIRIGEALPRSGEWRVISREFLRSFLRRHLAGETVVASPNVGCFLSLDDFAHGIPLFVGSYLKDTWWAFGQWNGKNCIEWLMYLWCKQECEVVYDKYDHRGSPS